MIRKRLLAPLVMALTLACTTSVETDPGTLFTIKLEGTWLISCQEQPDSDGYYSLRFDFDFPIATKQYFYYTDPECTGDSWVHYAFFREDNYDLTDSSEFSATFVPDGAADLFRFSFRTEEGAAAAKAANLCATDDWNAERYSIVDQECIPDLPQNPAFNADGFEISMSADSQEITLNGVLITTEIMAESLPLPRIDSCPESTRFDNCY